MAAKLKILHLSQATGGVKTYVAHVLANANSDLVEFIMVAPADLGFEQYCSLHSVPYYRVNLERGLNPFASAKALWQIISVICKYHPDIIHAHSAKGGLLGRVAAKLTRTKIIYTPHAFSYKSFTGLKRAIFYLLEYFVRHWTTYVLAISHTEAAAAINEVGFKPQKVGVILNSVPITEVPKKNTEAPVVNIGMISRLTAQKNPLLFLQIANQLRHKHPQLRFTILGAGIHDDLRDEIDQYLVAYQLSDCVTIQAWGDVETSNRFLQTTDIYVSTSVFEGLPFSVLEAMFYGLPCVVSNVEGNADVVRNMENGLSSLGLDGFCEAIEKLINQPQLRSQLGDEAYRYVRENHDIKKSTLMLEILYQQIAAQP